MSRKLYEKDTDIENETRVLRALEQHWHPVSITKLPKKYVLDAHANFGVHHAFLEIKCRSVASTTFDTYMIGLRKVLEGVQHAGVLPNGTFLLVVEWTDGLYYCDMQEALPHCRMDFGGRKDRDDREDTEPVVLVPVSRFVKIDVDRTAQ